jgi:hypothetical protein
MSPTPRERVFPTHSASNLMRKTGLLLVLLVLIPAASADTLQARLTAAQVRVQESLPADGEGLLVGLFQGDTIEPSWHLTAESLLVTTTTRPYTQVAGVGQRGQDDVASKPYYQANVTQTGVPASKAKEFWLLVTPLQEGFQVRAELPSNGAQLMAKITYDNDAYIAPGLPPGASQPDGMNHVTSSIDKPALEWNAARIGAIVLRGDFRVTLFQSDFTVTDRQGAHDYMTGDNDPGLASPVAHYEEIRADLDVRDGMMTLDPNGRTVQVDLAHLVAKVSGRLDLLQAQGTLQSGAEPVSGNVQMQAGGLLLGLSPTGDRFAVDLDGPAKSVAVDGRPFPLAPLTSTTAPTLGALLAFWLALVTVSVLVVAMTLLRRATIPTSLLLARAQADLDVGQPRRALRTSHRILRRQRGHPDATTILAMALIKLGEPAKALPVVERTRRDHGDQDGLLPFVHSIVLYKQGKQRQACQVLEQAFLDHPDLRHDLAATDLLDQMRLQVGVPA